MVAIATDESLATPLPQFSLDDAEAVAKFIIAHLGLRKAAIHAVKTRLSSAMLKVLFFASLRERLGVSEESIPLPDPATVGGLLEHLRQRGGEWADALADGKRWRVAVNQDMADAATALKAGDEVAIFPPVTGG